MRTNALTTRRSPLHGLFDSFFSDHLPELFPGDRAPATNIAETADGYELSFEMPGLAGDEIALDVHDRNLTVSAERKAVARQEGTKWHRIEQHHGKWSRTIVLPEAADTATIEAAYDQGLLRVTLQKRPESKPVRVQVKGS